MEQAVVHPCKRSYFSKREAFKIIQKQRSSKLSIGKFCELNQLAPSTFKRWLQRHGRDTQENYELPKTITRISKPRKTNLTPKYNNEEFIPLVLTTSSETINTGEANLFAEVNGIKIYQRVDAAFLKSLMS